MNIEEELPLYKPIEKVVDEHGSLVYDYTPENGQITMQTEFGKQLVRVGADPNYTTYFEVGTWKGNGTTRCLAEGIYHKYKSNRNRNSHLWSLESNLEFYKQATHFWSQIPIPYVHLLYGRLHENGILSKQEIIQHPNFNLIESHYNDWYEQDNEDYRFSPILDLSLLPEIDVVVLDGGEFSGYADWSVLKVKNPKIVCLDDIHVIKNERVFEELHHDPNWTLLVKNDERNGFAIFKKI